MGRARRLRAVAGPVRHVERNGAAHHGVLLVVLAATALLPAVAETPDFPATVFYDFRVATLVGQLVAWTGLGLVCGMLSDRGRLPGRTIATEPLAGR